MMMFISFLVACSFICVSAAQAVAPQSGLQTDVRGVKFDSVAAIGGRAVPLRGATLCRWRGFKVYTAAFYAVPEARSSDEVLGDVPKRLVLHYEREIPKEDIIEATVRTLRENPKVNLAELQPRLDLIYSWYQDVKEGDRFSLDYVPGEGSELFFNGESRGVIPGADFARAFFGIWVSEHPISKKYQKRLLGQ